MKKQMYVGLFLRIIMLLFSFILLFCLFGCKTDKTYEIDEHALFKCGLTPVMKGDKWGYINESAEIVIEPIYEKAEDFTENGTARVTLDGIDIYINTKGEKVSDAEPIEPQKKFHVYHENDKQGIKDPDGNIVLKAIYDGISVYIPNGIPEKFELYYEGKHGYADSKGNIVIEPIYEELAFNQDDILAAKLDKKWGFINSKGETVIDFQFTDAYGFYYGLAAVSVDNKWGFIDKTGKFIVEPCYSQVKNFSEYGLAQVKKDSKWGYINKNGEVCIDTIFDETNDFRFDIALVCLDGKYGYIDLSGNYIVTPKYSYATDFIGDFAAVCTVGRDVYLSPKPFAAINRKGEIISDYKYDYWVRYSDGYAIYYKVPGTEFILITADGTVIADNNDFDAISEYVRYVY